MICNTETVFQGSSQTTTTVIVSIMPEKKQKHKPAANLSTYGEYEPDTKKQVKLPPFARHFKRTRYPDFPK